MLEMAAAVQGELSLRTGKQLNGDEVLPPRIGTILTYREAILTDQEFSGVAL